VWNQPTTGFVFCVMMFRSIFFFCFVSIRHRQHQQPLRLPLESPENLPSLRTLCPPSPLVADATSNIFVPASFSYPPIEWIDSEPYLAPWPRISGNKSNTCTSTNADTLLKGQRARIFKEHDIVWRSVGSIFARWVKPEPITDATHKLGMTKRGSAAAHETNASLVQRTRRDGGNRGNTAMKRRRSERYDTSQRSSYGTDLPPTAWFSPWVHRVASSGFLFPNTENPATEY
jgi:hypothetical protein